MIEGVGIDALSFDILRTFGLLGRDGYTNAAAILADRNDFPGIDMVRFGDTEDIMRDRETVTGVSALEQMDRAFAVYERYYAYEKNRRHAAQAFGAHPRGGISRGDGECPCA